MPRPVEILAVGPFLHQTFDGIVPQSVDGDAQQGERDFFSRCLAALAVQKLAGASLADAAASVVDGGHDGGIDAAYISPATNTLWLVQAKYVDDGLSEPDLQSVIRFATGVENLLSGHHAEIQQNPAWAAKLPAIDALLSDPASNVRAVLCYSGLRLITEDRKTLFGNLRQRLANDDNDEFFAFRSANLTTIQDWITGGDLPRGAEAVALEIIRPGRLTEPYDVVFGLIALSSLNALYAEHGRSLIAANLRGMKGSTEVNDDIRKTVSEQPELFHCLNNGLTAYCDRLEDDNRDRVNIEKKRFTARGFSIINGAQTLGSISHSFAAAAEGQQPTGFAFIKIISLEKCEDDRAFADRVSRTANFQNHVGLGDFAAAYEVHEVLSRALSPHEIHYHYKLDEDTPSADEENFDIEEALTACACLANPGDCDFIYRVAANRDSLRSLEMIYPADQLQRSRHERVFPPDLSARTMWRAVQTQRIVLQVMRDAARAVTGATKSFYVNARWVVLAAIFKRLQPEEGEALALTEDERNAVTTAVSEYAERLLAIAVTQGLASYNPAPGGLQVLESVRDFQSIFKSQGDCQNLLNALKAAIFQNGN